MSGECRIDERREQLKNARCNTHRASITLAKVSTVALLNRISALKGRVTVGSRAHAVAPGKPDDKTTAVLDVIPQVYVNAGRWAKGHTDFVVVSENEIVLGSWANHMKEAGTEEEAAFMRKLVLSQVNAHRLKKFFDKTDRGFPIDWLAIEPSEKLRFTEPGELFVIVPDCHVHLFKGWIIDGFVKPVFESGKPKAQLGGVGERNSLEGDFAEFVGHADKSADKVIHLGDLFEQWQVQWLYELAYGIYKQWKSGARSKRRFPRELAARPNDWKTDQHSTQMWKRLEDYLKLDSGIPAIKQWHKKVAPLDVLAMIFWWFRLPWDATPLAESEFEDLYHLLYKALPQKEEDEKQGKQPTVDIASHKGWNSVSTIRKSVCLEEGDAASTLDFTCGLQVEDRIKSQYPLLKAYFDGLQENSNFIRGNHDCLTPNEYLIWKYHLGNDSSWEPSLLEGYVGDDDANVQLPPYLSKRCGVDDKICIEHGDAFDKGNNDRNYFRFDVNLKKLNGGYHVARDLFFKTQLLDAGSPVFKAMSFIGDITLEWDAESRMEAIFKSEVGKKVRLVILGHSHLPKLQYRFAGTVNQQMLAKTQWQK